MRQYRLGGEQTSEHLIVLLLVAWDGSHLSIKAHRGLMGMLSSPMSGAVNATAGPHAPVLEHSVDEARKPGPAAGPADIVADIMEVRLGSRTVVQGHLGARPLPSTAEVRGRKVGCLG